jgi:O-antigen chain-terminating methyltransferase
MPQTAPDTPLDIDALTMSIRAEIERRREDAPLASTAAPTAVAPASAPELDTAWMLMEQAQRVAETGTRVPPFGVFGPLRRQLARAFTRILYALLRVITVDQTVFNKLVLDVLGNVANGVRRGDNAARASLTAVERSVRDHEASLRDALARQQELETALTASGSQLAQLESTWRERLGEVDDRLGRLADAGAELEARLHQVDDAIAALQSESAAQARRVAVALAQHWTERAAAGDRLAAPAAVASYSQNDQLYVAFEEAFRGSPEEIANRQRTYLPVIQAAQIGMPDAPILDLGCGRGEWLDLLRQAGLAARGVDSNLQLVEHCQHSGLDVLHGDALATLRDAASASLGAVTAFQLVEHLPFDSFIALIDETVRVLRPGGVAIFETPNPENVLVGSCSFYFDPSHVRPLPAPMVKFFLEIRGLHRVEIVYLNPPDARPLTPQDSELIKLFNHYFFGPRDYAAMGWKP